MTSIGRHPVVEKLVEKQRSLGLNDEQMADKLGISRPLWSMTRSYKMPVGLSLLQGAARAFDDLDEYILDYLAS